MSQLLSDLKIFGQFQCKNEIKYYHVYDIDFFGNKRALFVTNDKKVYGINIDLELMTPSYISIYDKIRNKRNMDKEKPIELKELEDKKIKEFYIEKNFVLALSEENKLYSWGRNYDGQLGRDTKYEFDANPREIIYFTKSRSKIKQICIRYSSIMVLLDNKKLVIWGDNEIRLNGRLRYKINLGDHFSDDWTKITEPVELDLLMEIEFIDLNNDGCFLIDKAYDVFFWGHDKYGQLGKEKLYSSQPEKSEMFSKLEIISVKTYDYELYYGNNYVTYLLSSDGKLFVWGKDKKTEKKTLELIYGRKLLKLEKIDFRMVVLSDEQIVYEVKENELIRTNYKSLEEYSVLIRGITFKTFEILRMKDFEINLIQQIGHGAFGKVYKVFFETHYALKKILINDETKNYLDKNSELQIMKQLKSDFVVNLYDYWIKSENDFDFIYIKIELCDQSLKDMIEVKKPSIPAIIDYMIRTEIFKQLLFALNYLHSMTPKVIHRDIKPSNILIKYHNDHAQCKLCDFGLAKILEKESSNTSNVGTSHYRAPEISTNKYNEKIDIFSLGISIREMFANSFVVETNDYDLSRNLKNLKTVITKMIHGEADKRPSADDIIKKMFKFSIDINKRKDLQTLIEKGREKNNYDPLKFLNVDLKTKSTDCTCIIS